MNKIQPPSQSDWIEMPTPVSAWWLLKIIEDYEPKSMPPANREDCTYQTSTMLVHVPDYEHNTRPVIEKLNTVVEWLHQNSYLQQDIGQASGLYLISSKGFKYMDSEFSEPPTIDDIRNLHELILNQIKSTYLLGQSSYRGAITDAFTLVLDRIKQLTGRTVSNGQDVKFLRNVMSTAPPGGLMTDPSKARSREEFFAGNYATFRHVPSHTFKGSESKQLCLEALYSASTLMRKLDEIESELP